jgi:hypothetical protein
MVFILGIPGEVRLVVSLALFAIAGGLLYSIRYYMIWDEKLREAVWEDGPWHVFLRYMLAVVLCFIGVFILPSPL